MKTAIRFDTLLRTVCCLLCLAAARPGLAQTGTVLSFGDNHSGQMGDNTTTTRTQPTPAFYVSAITTVACGTYHTLALDSGGTVWAWGQNSAGQLGTGDTADRHTPVAVLTGIKAIAAGSIHSLALTREGTVLAWGFNRYGQLGTGDTFDRYLPTPINSEANRHIKAIAAGGTHSLLLADDSSLYGCGLNTMGELGLRDFTNRPTLTYIQRSVVAVAAGSDHTMILGGGNDVYVCGFNATGQVGDGTTVSRNYFTPVVRNARAISAGFNHSMALRQDGTVMAWGDNNFGQLGMGDTVRRTVPTQMPGAANIKAIAAGGRHSLLLTAGGNVLATGDNLLGQMGNGAIGGIRKSLAQVANASMIASIAAGGFHSVLLRPYTKALATGLNHVGQLGIGSAVANTYAPVPVANVTNILAVATGNSYGMHSLFLRADGTVWASGWNDYGQLGDGTYTSRSAPVQVKGPNGIGYLSNIIAIAAGDYHSMALAADGSLYTWGSNQDGQLGMGRQDVAKSRYPYHLSRTQASSSGVFAIAAGSRHSLTLSRDGRIAGCGWNVYGQLGLGHPYKVFSFTSNLDVWGQTAIAAGGAHSLSLGFLGEIRAWGSNYIGQLGMGDTLDRNRPTVNHGTLATAIACGGNHSMALNGYNQVWVCGGNPSGELGLGDTTPRYEWTYNNIVPNTIGIASGLGHCLYLNAGGTLTASGAGAQGQLGNGAASNSSYPLLVSSPFGNIAMAGGAYHTLILAMPPILIQSVTVSPASVTGGASATGTVTLNGLAGPGGQRVYLNYFSQDSNGRYVNAASMPAYVDVPPNSNQASFPITTKAVASLTTTTIAGYLNQVVTTTLTIRP